MQSCIQSCSFSIFTDRALSPQLFIKQHISSLTTEPYVIHNYGGASLPLQHDDMCICAFPGGFILLHLKLYSSVTTMNYSGVQKSEATLKIWDFKFYFI